MTTDVQHILTAYDSLSAAEKQEAAIELLRRFQALSLPEMSGDLLTSLADELFSELDAREAEDAQR